MKRQVCRFLTTARLTWLGKYAISPFEEFEEAANRWAHTNNVEEDRNFYLGIFVFKCINVQIFFFLIYYLKNRASFSFMLYEYYNMLSAFLMLHKVLWKLFVCFSFSTYYLHWKMAFPKCLLSDSKKLKMKAKKYNTS